VNIRDDIPKGRLAVVKVAAKNPAFLLNAVTGPAGNCAPTSSMYDSSWAFNQDGRLCDRRRRPSDMLRAEAVFDKGGAGGI
jgi:hypothetical protein